MPNHVTTVCQVTGPDDDIARFRSTHFSKDENGWRFDFQTIIPMPKVLDGIEKGSETELGMAVLVARSGIHIVWELVPELRDVIAGHTPYELQKVACAWVEKNRPSAIEKGKRALAAIAETGFASWYDWSIPNWGTKWNSYDYEERASEPGSFTFKFETAWDFPRPVLTKLAEAFPTLVFDCASFDEGGNFAGKGQFNGRNDYAESTELAKNPDHYEYVYGEKMPKDEDEDEDASSLARAEKLRLN